MSRENIHISSLEKIVKDYLDKNEIGYIFQFSTRTGFVIDFAILEKMVAVEVDGEKWHETEDARKRDRFKDYMLERGGWRVIRIKEREIGSLDNLLSSIIR